MSDTIFDQVAELCRKSAHASLDSLIELGPRPSGESEGILWDIQARRLRNQIDSLSNMASDLTAKAILVDLSDFQEKLDAISLATKKAKESIDEIKEVSRKLSKFAKLLDLGLALLALPAAAGSVATLAPAVGAAVKAGQELAKDDDGSDWAYDGCTINRGR